jgi:hypothetical protein
LLVPGRHGPKRVATGAATIFGNVLDLKSEI